MPWSEIEGQERAVEQLRRSLAGRQLHHAYLVVGPEGVGKELLARLLAQAANCDADEPLRPCGACKACAAIAKNNHPDVLWTRPQAEWVARGVINKADLEAAPSREIRVDEVRQLTRRLSFSLVAGRRKISVVSPADALNERAQNALLKTLEEPPPDTTFALVTAQPDQLLPTVRSRCARLALGPLPEEVVARLLARSGTAPAAAQVRAARAGGSVGRALALTVEEVARRDERLRQLGEALDAPDERAALELAEALAEREDAVEAVGLLEEALRLDLLAAAAGTGGASRTSTSRFRSLALCGAVAGALDHNGNPRLQLERLLLGLRLHRSAGAES
jgi:DNA polymerase-3 subunit delta'